MDAERLALLFRGDLLPTVWIPPAALREARELIRHRVSLVWLRGEVRNRLLAMLARRNLQPTSGKSWLTVRGQRELHALPLTPIAVTIREDCRALLPLLDEQIRRLDDDLRQRWGEDPRVRHLMTLPGVGAFIAIVLVMELGDIHRFPSAKHVASTSGSPRGCARVPTGSGAGISVRKAIASCAGCWCSPRPRRPGSRVRCERGSGR